MKKSTLALSLALGASLMGSSLVAMANDSTSLFELREASNGQLLACDGEKKCGSGSCGSKGESKCGSGACGSKDGEKKCGSGACGSKSGGESKCGSGACGSK